MKSKIRIIAILSVTGLFAKITTYDYPSEVERSDKYEITVKQNGRRETAFVHISRCPEQTHPLEKILPLLYDRTLSWTQIVFDGGPAEISVRKLYGEPAKKVTIAPKRYGVVPEAYDGHSVRFKMDRPEYVSVRFHCEANRDEYDQIRHGLMVFADAPFMDPPAPGDPGVTVFSSTADLEHARVIYFEPGVHDLVRSLPNGMLPVHDNQTVYIPGGAFVFGGISAPSTYNVRIFGHGVLSGAKQPFHYPGLPQLCELEPWNYRTNVHRGGYATVEGITLLESFNHNLAVGTHSLVKDVKFMAWKVNNDGIRSGDGSVIDHCFFKVSDDHLYAFSATLMCNNLFWPMWNGAVLQLGWGDYGGSGTRFVNNTIIHPEWNQWWYNNGVIASQVRPGSRNSDILIQDLYIEGDINALANLHFREGSEKESGPFDGFIREITFRNVILDGRLIWQNTQNGWYDHIPKSIRFDVAPDKPVQRGRSLIQGVENASGDKAFVHHVVFENLAINGVWVTKSNASDYFDVDTSTTHDIRFVQTSNYDGRLSHRPGYARSNDYTMENLGAGALDMGLEIPELAAHSGWLKAEQSSSWTIEIPEAGLFDVKISVAGGLNGAEYLILVDGEAVADPFTMTRIIDNGYNLHKQVTPEPVQLAAGKHTITMKTISGMCQPDYVEITPHTGEIPHVDVQVRSVSVMITKGDDWVAAGLNIGLTPETLSFNSRAGVVINPDERGPIRPLPANQVDIFNRKGEAVIVTQSNDLARRIDISRLPFGPYLVHFTDGESFWIAKQVVK